MTSVSTLLAPILPVGLGLLVRLVAPRLVAAVVPVLPWVSVIAIAIIVAIVVAGSRDKLAQAGLVVLLVVVLHNALGYALGYATGKATGQTEQSSRTMGVEVGMQSPGLAATLAKSYRGVWEATARERR